MTESAQEKLNRSRAMFAESAEAMLSLAADLCDQWERDLGAGPAIAHLNDVRHGIETARRAAAKVTAPGLTVHGFPCGNCDWTGTVAACTCHTESERFAS